MRILFHEYSLNVRGSSQAVFDYAHYAETLLGHEAVITYDASVPDNDAGALRKFQDRFAVVPYQGDFAAQIGGICTAQKIDLAYFLKSGERDGRLAPGVPNAVHVIFQRFAPHGDAYAYVSEWLSDLRSGGRYGYVPHIVALPPAEGNLRAALKIPREAFVFGRYGGFETFDIDFVKQGIAALLEDPKLWCVFVNTERFIDHPRALFLPAITAAADKSRFIATCDAMIHARRRGESFGLAIAEFLFHGKPVLAWAGGKDGNHRRMLAGAPAALYRDGPDFLRKARALALGAGAGFDWQSLVADFAPEAAMRRFQSAFIDRTGRVPPDIGSWQDHWDGLSVNLRYQIRRRISRR